jgi:predicted Zn-dependent peptidase
MTKKNKSNKLKKQTQRHKKHQNETVVDTTQFRYYHMDCGIKLVMIHNPKSTFMKLECSIEGGCSEEPDHLAGITHFLEHLVFRRTKHFKSESDMSEFVEKNGLRYNAYTSIKETNFHFSGPSKIENINNAFFVLKEMMFNMELDDHIFETERNIVIQEYFRDIDNPENNYYTSIIKNYYNNHPLSKLPIGNIECLRQITRQDVINYYKSMYNLHDMTIYITGNIPDFRTNKIVEFCDYYFCKRADTLWTPSIKLPLHNKDPLGTFDVNEINGILRKNYFQQKTFLKHNPNNPGLHPLESNAKINQNYIEFAFPLPGKYSINRILIEAIFGILRGGKKSKLFKLLREEYGLTYNVTVGTDIYIEGGNFYISIGVNIADTQKAINILTDFFSKVKGDTFFTPEELTFFKTRFLIDIEEDKKPNNAVNFHTNNIINYYEIISIDNVKEQISNIKLKDLNEYTKTVLNMDNLYVYVYGSELKGLKVRI